MSVETAPPAAAGPTAEPRPRPPRGRNNPLVPFLRRWGGSIASVIGGVLTLLVFRHEVDHVRWIVGYLLLAWIISAIIAQVHRAIVAAERRVHPLFVAAADYAIQSLHHGVLLFLLAPYWASTTLTSVNVLFFALLVGLVVLATIDPLYRAVVPPRPWLGALFFFVSTFGALNLALPLVGVPPHVALPLAAWVGTVALTSVVVHVRGWGWLRALFVTTTAGVAVAALIYAGRLAVPPAPLFVADTHLTWNFAMTDVVDPVARAIATRELRERGLVVHTAVYAPAGLTQPIRHVWRKDGKVIDDVALSPVHGGRYEGFRTFSRKTSWPADARGSWRVDVMTGAGQLVGRVSFRVTG